MKKLETYRESVAGIDLKYLKDSPTLALSMSSYGGTQVTTNLSALAVLELIEELKKFHAIMEGPL